jgi:hypothetical protein
MFTWRAAPCSLFPSLVEEIACRLLLQALFTKILHGKLSLPPSPVCSEYPTSSAAYHFQFLFYYSGFFFFFCGVGVSLFRELCWFIPGVAVWIQCATYLLTFWSVSPKQAWIQCLEAQDSSSFLSVTWLGEALYGLEVQVSEFCFFFVIVFSAKCGSSISANFWFMELTLPLVTILDSFCSTLSISE